jgi:hypothetical protein
MADAGGHTMRSPNSSRGTDLAIFSEIGTPSTTADVSGTGQWGSDIRGRVPQFRAHW